MIIVSGMILRRDQSLWDLLDFSRHLHGVVKDLMGRAGMPFMLLDLIHTGVSMASLTELNFNWTCFISAMISNIAFTYRSIYSKKSMTVMDSTNVYAYTSVIALLVYIPPAIIIEGPILMQHCFADAIAKAGPNKFLSDLF